MPTRIHHRQQTPSGASGTVPATGCSGRRTTSLVDTATAAELIGTSPRHVKRLVFERRIPYVKVGHFVRFDPGELHHWIDQHRMPEVGCTRPRRR